jgi:hypothetical protein
MGVWLSLVYKLSQTPHEGRSVEFPHSTLLSFPVLTDHLTGCGACLDTFPWRAPIRGSLRTPMIDV